MIDRTARSSDVILLGGSGFIGSHLIHARAGRAGAITVVDREAPRTIAHPRIDRWIKADIARDPVDLPDGRVVVLIGGSDNHSLHRWTHFQDSCIALARIAPALAGRDVVLLSSVEIYGERTAQLSEATPPRLPIDHTILDAWSVRLVDDHASGSAISTEVLERSRECDPDGRWAYALAKRVQELMILRAVGADRTHILRLGNVYGVGQFRVLGQLVAQAMGGRAMTVVDTARSFVSVDRVVDVIGRCLDDRIPPGLYNVAGGRHALAEIVAIVRDELRVETPIHMRPAPRDDVARDIDTSRIDALAPIGDEGDAAVRRFVRACATTPTAIEPAIPVVIPPRPFDPDAVTRAQRAVLQSGALKLGNVWTSRLADRLAQILAIPSDRTLLLTNSGTSALRMAVTAAAGPASPGDVAILPSFTFAATGEALVQLGYRLRFCDIDPETWTMAPDALADALAKGGCKVVVSVDALGNPCDYTALNETCRRFDVPLVADSAPALGAFYQEEPVGSQVAAHAFSMSFAKVVSAGGAGGAVVVRSDHVDRLCRGEHWWRSSQMTELAAIVALDQVERLDQLIARRAAVADAYNMLETAAAPIAPQRTIARAQHAWVHWAARFPDRDRLEASLATFGVGTKPYYAPALHRMEWYGRAESAGPLPVTTAVVSDVLALPTSSEIGRAQAEQISLTVRLLVERGGGHRRAHGSSA